MSRSILALVSAQALETGSWIAGIGSFFVALVSLWLSSRPKSRKHTQEPSITVEELKQILLEARETKSVAATPDGGTERPGSKGRTEDASERTQDLESSGQDKDVARYGDISWWDDRIDLKRAKYNHKPRSSADNQRMLLVAAVFGVVAALGFVVNLLSGVFL